VSSDAKTLVKVMHRKIVFVKVESSVIELSESVHWSRRFGEKMGSHRTTSCQHTLYNKLVYHN